MSQDDANDDEDDDGDYERQRMLTTIDVLHLFFVALCVNCLVFVLTHNMFVLGTLEQLG